MKDTYTHHNDNNDSTHPTYRPHGDLGGEEGFRSMIEQVHADGFRIMIHTTGWGIDPYHPDIDRLEKLVVRRENGEFEGWQMGPWGNPPKNSLKFTTGRLPLRSSPEIDPGSDSFLVETPFIPSGCEALLTIGGFRGYRGRVRLTVDRRSVSTPAGRRVFGFYCCRFPAPAVIMYLGVASGRRKGNDGYECELGRGVGYGAGGLFASWGVAILSFTKALF